MYKSVYAVYIYMNWYASTDLYKTTTEYYKTATEHYN